MISSQLSRFFEQNLSESSNARRHYSASRAVSTAQSSLLLLFFLSSSFLFLWHPKFIGEGWFLPLFFSGVLSYGAGFMKHELVQ